jgi:hypothetical protein
MRVAVPIDNPPVGCKHKSSLERARRYERAGRARFVGPLVIRFLDTTAQAAIVKAAEVRPPARVTGNVYDEVDRSFHRDARNLPVISRGAMIREGKSDLDWSHKADSNRRLGRDHHACEVAKLRSVRA